MTLFKPATYESAKKWQQQMPCNLCDRENMQCQGRCTGYDEWWSRRPNMHKETRFQSLIAKSGVIPFMTRCLDGLNIFLKKVLNQKG